jgi:proteasome lid subunit RPN8/RPN11
VGLFRKSEPTPRRRRTWGIQRDVLDMIAESARATHPREFGAAMRAEGGVIHELVLVPGTIGGDAHAFLPLYQLPYDPSICGTVHSHPSPNPQPSDADRQLFNAFGHTHLIMAAPYGDRTWVAYDQNGQIVKLEIVEQQR